MNNPKSERKRQSIAGFQVGNRHEEGVAAMSSSSAFNNVLLKSPVQTQAGVAPKRDFQSDNSATDFSQTFNNLRDTAQEKIERPAKRMLDKKTAPLENTRASNEARAAKKPVKESTPVEKKMPTDSVDGGEHPVAKDKKIAQKNTTAKEIKKSDEGDEELLTNPNSPAPEAVDTATSLAITLGTALDTLESETSSSDAAELTVDLEADSSAVSVNASNGAPTDALNSALTQSAAENGVNNSVTSNTSTATQNAIANSESIPSAVVSVVTTPALKTSGDQEAGETAEVSGELDAQIAEDPKSVFEKMLQTVAKTGTREESAPVNALQNTNGNSQHSLTDAVARFSDAPTPAARSFVVQTAVPVPVGQPQWSQAVGEKVLWLAAQNVSSAEINLHPKDLGPMQVKVSVNQEQTSVSFTSHHPMVREVLDQNLNRLRDMFNEQGLNLVNVDVSDKSFSRQQGEGNEQKGQSGTNNVNEEEAVIAVTTIVQQRLVDHYA